MKKKIKLSPAAKTVLNRLKENGYEGYIVGGSVRDSLMGIPPHDFDITTSALPERVSELFPDRTVVETGLKHGTVTVVIEGEPIEVTTFRSDGAYTDGRHPEAVSFTGSLTEDLKRRDFTVNAIAYSEESGIIDLFGGEADIKNGIIRTVGEPRERFSEDALRILRALRFASTYGFMIEENTKRAIDELKERLSALSAERIFSELKRIIVGRDAERILLEYPQIIAEILPELRDCIGFDQHTPYHKYDVYTHTVKTLAACPRDTVTRLAALFHDTGKPETFTEKDEVGHFYSHAEKSHVRASAAMNRLRSDNATKDAVLKLVLHHDLKLTDATEKSVKRWMHKLGAELFSKLVDLMIADNSAKTEESLVRLTGYEEVKRIMTDIIESDSCFSLKQLKLNGSDLIALGVPKGKEIGKTLDFLLEKVISGEIENEREALIAFLEKGC